MDQLEHGLRSLLTDDRLAVPVATDPAGIVRAGMRRRRRNRALAATVGTIALVGAVAVPLLLTSGTDRRDAPPIAPNLRYDVPWVAAPAPRHLWSPPDVTPSPPPDDAPLCRADQLRPGHATGNGATGMLLFWLEVRNVSSTPCSLGDYPTAVAHRSGSPDVVADRQFHGYSDNVVAGNIEPGSRGTLLFETDRDCPARYATPRTFPSNVYDSVTFTLPSGTSFTLPMKLDVECGLHVGPMGIRWRSPHSRPNPQQNLVATVDQVPAQVTAGDDLRFVVILLNNSRHAISLSHCPGYQMTLADTASSMLAPAPDKAEAITDKSYALNCAAHRRIRPGASVSYEMRLAVPAAAPAGAAELSWRLLVLSSISRDPDPATAEIQVVR